MENRVLVVDDEKIIVKGLKFSLEQEGWRVDCAYDGEEALEMAGKNNYSIILLDLMLPKLSGTEVCQQIRETSNVPIIMLTAKSDDMDKIMGLEYGARRRKEERLFPAIFVFCRTAREYLSKIMKSRSPVRSTIF